MEHLRKASWSRFAKAFVGLLLVVSVSSVMVPQRAYALFGVGDIVIDPTNLVQNTVNAVASAAEHTKEYVFDTLAWQVGNLAIQSMTKSLVNWINSGFKGSPAFVTDLKQNLQGVGDAVASQFFRELKQESTGIAKTPHQDKVLDAIRLAYYLHTSPESFYTKNPYTLNQVSSDDRAFLQGDFKKGGFNAWIETVMNPQNNPYGAEMLANKALEDAVAGATGTRLQELSWNRGFLSWRGDCLAKKPLVSAEQAAADAANVPLGGEDTCASYAIKTPGSVIMEQLNTQLGSSVNRLVSADEFNEIIGALMNQLVLQVVGGGDGGGLSGTSRPSAGGGSSYIDQATSASQSGNSAGISQTFTTTIANQKRYVTQYQEGWERLRMAAQAAVARCANVGTPSPQEVVTEAGAALAKAADAAAALDAIQTRITAATNAGGNQTSELLSISEEYNELLSSNTLPSAEDISDVQVESQDSGDAEPPTLYTQLTRLAASRTCDASDE